MSITGIFFIPSHPNTPTALALVTERLRSVFADEPVPVGRWALEHKLMRDTPSCLPTSATLSHEPLKPRYMQFLSLSHYPTHGFIYTSEPTESASTPPLTKSPTEIILSSSSEPMVMSTVPLPSYGSLFQHFIYACQPFWCHRHTVTVPGGIVYDVGDFRVRIGDVRQTVPAARVRGTVVEIEWKGPTILLSLPSHNSSGTTSVSFGTAGGNLTASRIDDGFVNEKDEGMADSAFDIDEADIDAEYMATGHLIREFWNRLGIDGAKEAVLVPGLGTEVKDRLRKWKRRKSDMKRGQNEYAMDTTEEDPEPDAGADLARQYMEIFRFNR